MKRSGFKPRTKPMSRGSWGRKDAPLPETLLRRARIKARVKKPTVAEGSKYLAACRGEECYLRVSGICQAFGWGNETVVPCHSNQSRHGKGGSLKAQHIFTVPGCAACHAYIDQGSAAREEKFAIWDRAYERWEPVRAAKMGIELKEAA